MARVTFSRFGPDSRMIGTSSCGELKLATNYGDALIPYEKVAAFVGGNHGRRRVSRVFLSATGKSTRVPRLRTACAL